MSIIETALRYDLDIECQPYRVQVNLYDTRMSETHTFAEEVNRRKDRRAALVRCITKAAAKGRELEERYGPQENLDAG